MGHKGSPDKITIFVVKECNTRSICACVCPTKGAESQVAAELFLDAVQELGFRDAPIMYKCDQEPALLDVINLVSSCRKSQTIPENSPVGQSQSNGSIENAVSLVQSRVRRLKLALEERLGHQVPQPPLYTLASAACMFLRKPLRHRKRRQDTIHS